MTPNDRITGRSVEPMDAEKKARIEAKGYWVGDAEDFLGLSEPERAIVEFRLKLSRWIKEARERRGMSQTALARAMGTSQPRLSRIEAGYPDVTIDLMLRALGFAGGDATIRPVVPARSRLPKIKAPKLKTQPSAGKAEADSAAKDADREKRAAERNAQRAAKAPVRKKSTS